jgi:Plasmid pRiA4b ORF-3-like protein
MLYALSVELLNVKPLIRQRIRIKGKASLAALHYDIQIALGWTDAYC